MDEDDSIHDAFTTENLWKSSSFFQDPSAFDSSLFAPLQLDVPSITFDHPYAPKVALDRELQLPDLETFEFGPLPELESFDQSSLSIGTPPLPYEEDVWQVALELGPANKHVRFYDWELFENGEDTARKTPYITESGPQALDAAFVKDNEQIAAGRVLTGDVFLTSLWNLGLGRSSILFNWNPNLRTFVPAIADGRTTGLSLASAESLTNRFILIGNTFLYLRSFIERTFAAPASIPARVALATSISSILSTFEDHLGRHSNIVKSILQLQRLFQKPGDVLMHVARIVETVKHARTNEQLASILHHRVLELEEGDDVLRQLSTEILYRVSKPSLELLGEWIGTQKEQDTLPVEQRESFVVVEEDSEEQRPVAYAYNAEAMPRFVNPEDGNTIFETGNSLRFLRLHHPDHPLTALEKYSVRRPELEWKFSWEDIEMISAKAKAYEDDLRSAILKFAKGSVDDTTQDVKVTDDGPQLDQLGALSPEGDFAKYFEESAKVFDEVPTQSSSTLPDNLQILTIQLLSDSPLNEPSPTFSPPLSITSAMSFCPLIAAQAKLVNAATLRLFFRSHKLRMHLSLQRQYHLLGDGVFSSRLASALFDPERESAERHKGTMRSGVQMGLQVGSRETWPPASSELRLALMGVLSESFYTSALYASIIAEGTTDDLEVSKDKGELPGQLNFAIRQLNEPEMEKIMDPDSLYALDFLRLQYIPMSPLHLVISSVALEKYDSIFKFLLRLLRMVFVIAHLPRSNIDLESRLFRLEAHHFVTALSTYIFHTGIAEHWDTFETYVTTIETSLAEEDEGGELGSRVTSGLESLKSAHEQCLDSIMFSLLLRRRQKKVMTLLEEIFDHILLFAKMTRDEDGSKKHDIRELYTKLKGKIRVFISVCRGLTGKKGYGKGKGTSEENTLERLGVLLEMNGYYSS